MSTEDDDAQAQALEALAISTVKTPPILALIIGINQYASPEFKDLAGAVGDADSFEQLLKVRLNVPTSNITSLRDEQATRAAILSGFISLRDNALYKKDEAAIVIYYAGHGAQVEKPVEWEDWVSSGGQIEMLCPSDIGCSIITKINGEEYDDIIPGIPDRTISVLLNHISDFKGNNITVILDCCSSAGINRGESFREPEEYVARQISNPPPLNPNADRAIWSRGTRSGGIADGFSGKFHASHILLAACGRDQFAREDPRTKRGLFTYSLLKVLESNSIEDLTYTSLMHKMKMPKWQTPHCEGQSVNRRIFNTRAPGADTSFILTKREQDSPILLEAGAAQGITVGSRLSVHASNLIETDRHPNASLGELIVATVHAFASELEHPPEARPIRLQKLFYCRISHRASQKIALYCENRTWLETIFPPQEQERLSIELADEVTSCSLQLTNIEGRVHFDRYNDMVTPHIGSRIRHTVGAEDIYVIRNVVQSSANFYQHLTRTGADDFRNVWMELKALKEELSNDFDQVFNPIGANLIADEPATVVVDEFARLGMTIFNQTDLPLYAYLFYFDPTDLTIIDWYTPPFGAGMGRLTTKVDAPLPPRSLLSVGYGDGGVPPWQFLLHPGDTKDIGFFKLFLSTRPAYFSSILQESPFEISSFRGGKPTPASLPDEERWAAKLVTIIQLEK
ncbi:caspase domain-containing protein [Crassisporium funariophilum]|nr:caspase domain-containing protein [Crassisporium funariophilum]